MAFKLADLFVEFSVKGSAEVRAQIDKVKAGISEVTDIATKGFAVATASLGGWVAAGLAGTVQGDQLAYSTRRLAQEITALFLPAIEKATELVRDITDWFRSLSGEQQDSLMKWTLWGVGALGTIVFIGKLIPAVVSLAGTIRTLATAFAVLNAMTGNWLGLLAGVAAATAAVIAVGKMLPDENQKKAGGAGRRSVQLSGGGPESITQTYQRIQAASLRTGNERDYAKETADNTQQIGQATAEQIPLLNSIEKKTQPAVGK